MLSTVKIIKYLHVFSMNNYFVKDHKVKKNLRSLPKKFCEFPPRSSIFMLLPKISKGPLK